MFMERLKAAARATFYRSAGARFLIGLLSMLVGRTKPLRVLHLLSYVDANAVGPLQKAEALLLNAVTQVVQPRVIVEFGFFKGHSAFNFLQALEKDAQVYSYDIASHAQETARTAFGAFDNFHFLHKSQDQFSAADIAFQKIDLVYFDAVHELALNQKTWEQIRGSLSPDCLVVVHDTGSWTRAHALAVHGELGLRPDRWLSESEYEHQPEERQFVNWIIANYSDYAMIHFHTLRTLRHGLTILQRQRTLPSAVAPSSLRHDSMFPESGGRRRNGTVRTCL